MRRPLRRERGAILAWAGLMLMMLFAFGVVAVDVGRLAFTANEVQSVADIAATAGATAAWEGGNAVAQAQSVVALNTVDGAPASIDASDVILGRYDGDTGTFMPGATPTNAVRANAMATVSNILAIMLGTPTTTVEKISTAVFATVQNGTPTLPLAIGECHFQNLCPTCLPELTNSPNPDNNSAWTGFFSGRTEADITSFMPETCGGGGAALPELNVGDSIQLNNSPLSAALAAVQCQLSSGQREFVVPVVAQDSGSDDEDDGDDSTSGDGDDDSGSDDGVDSDDHDDGEDGDDSDDDDNSGDGDDGDGDDSADDADGDDSNDGDDDDGGDDSNSDDDDSFSNDGEGSECDGSLNESGEVVGFLTVHIDSVGETGINLHGIFNASVPGTPGGNCENCGTGHAVIVD